MVIWGGHSQLSLYFTTIRNSSNQLWAAVHKTSNQILLYGFSTVTQHAQQLHFCYSWPYTFCSVIVKIEFCHFICISPYERFVPVFLCELFA